MGPHLDLQEHWCPAVTATRDKLDADGRPPISTDGPVAIQNLVQRDPHLDGALLVRLPAAAP